MFLYEIQKKRGLAKHVYISWTEDYFKEHLKMEKYLGHEA